MFFVLDRDEIEETSTRRYEVVEGKEKKTVLILTGEIYRDRFAKGRKVPGSFTCSLLWGVRISAVEILLHSLF